MSEPNSVEELRLDLRDTRLQLAEAYDAMRRMQRHIDVLINDKMIIAEELTEAREAVARVTALSAEWSDGYSEHGWFYANALTEALKGDSDDV